MTSLSQRFSCAIAAIGSLLLFIAAAAYAQSADAPRAAQAPAAAEPAPRTAVAIFAGGCFWCMEPPFDKLPGVISTTSGYTGGRVPNPTYEQVSAGGTGHAEAVQVKYDPTRIGYAQLLEVFWRNIDPLAVDRQFCDVGDQYRSAIFPIGAEQQRLAEASKRRLQDSGRFDRPIATQIVAASRFYPAERYHRTTTRRIPSATSSIVSTADATRGSKNSGASRILRTSHKRRELSRNRDEQNFPCRHSREGGDPATFSF